VVQRADLLMYEEKRAHYANPIMSGSSED
jgi:hypothetical protein